MADEDGKTKHFEDTTSSVLRDTTSGQSELPKGPRRRNSDQDDVHRDIMTRWDMMNRDPNDSDSPEHSPASHNYRSKKLHHGERQRAVSTNVASIMTHKTRLVDVEPTSDGKSVHTHDLRFGAKKHDDNFPSTSNLLHASNHRSDPNFQQPSFYDDNFIDDDVLRSQEVEFLREEFLKATISPDGNMEFPPSNTRLFTINDPFESHNESSLHSTPPMQFQNSNPELYSASTADINERFDAMTNRAESKSSSKSGSKSDRTNNDYDEVTGLGRKASDASIGRKISSAGRVTIPLGDNIPDRIVVSSSSLRKSSVKKAPKDIKNKNVLNYMSESPNSLSLSSSRAEELVGDATGFTPSALETQMEKRMSSLRPTDVLDFTDGSNRTPPRKDDSTIGTDTSPIGHASNIASPSRLYDGIVPRHLPSAVDSVLVNTVGIDPATHNIDVMSTSDAGVSNRTEKDEQRAMGDAPLTMGEKMLQSEMTRRLSQNKKPSLMENSNSGGKSTPLESVTPSKINTLVGRSRHNLEMKTCLIMVGLPARGKSYISKRLMRYISWLGYSTRNFNVGNRRRIYAKKQHCNDCTSDCTKDHENDVDHEEDDHDNHSVNTNAHDDHIINEDKTQAFDKDHQEISGHSNHLYVAPDGLTDPAKLVDIEDPSSATRELMNQGDPDTVRRSGPESDGVFSPIDTCTEESAENCSWTPRATTGDCADEEINSAIVPEVRIRTAELEDREYSSPLIVISPENATSEEEGLNGLCYDCRHKYFAKLSQDQINMPSIYDSHSVPLDGPGSSGPGHDNSLYGGRKMEPGISTLSFASNSSSIGASGTRPSISHRPGAVSDKIPLFSKQSGLFSDKKNHSSDSLSDQKEHLRTGSANVSETESVNSSTDRFQRKIKQHLHPIRPDKIYQPGSAIAAAIDTEKSSQKWNKVAHPTSSLSNQIKSATDLNCGTTTQGSDWDSTATLSEFNDPLLVNSNDSSNGSNHGVNIPQKSNAPNGNYDNTMASLSSSPIIPYVSESLATGGRKFPADESQHGGIIATMAVPEGDDYTLGNPNADMVEEKITCRSCGNGFLIQGYTTQRKPYNLSSTDETKVDAKDDDCKTNEPAYISVDEQLRQDDIISSSETPEHKPKALTDSKPPAGSLPGNSPTNRLKKKVLPPPISKIIAKVSTAYDGLDVPSVPALHASSPMIAGPKDLTTHDASFFDPDNQESKNLRDKLALSTLEELIQWLHDGGMVGIHDATNSTAQRRRLLLERLSKEPNIRTIFIESICNDKQMIDMNVEMKLQGPDYINKDPDQSRRDFVQRMHNYEKSYETIGSSGEDADDFSYIQLVNVGKRVITQNVRGYLPSQCVFYLMQLHLKPRIIWLSRHGESLYNRENRIGGDPPLTERGKKYARALGKLMKKFYPPTDQHTVDGVIQTDLTGDPNVNYTKEEPRIKWPPRIGSVVYESAGKNKDGEKEKYLAVPLTVWTSTLRRTKETGNLAFGDDGDKYEVRNMKSLNEIYAGNFEDMTYDEVRSRYPREFVKRKRDKLMYRYPGSGGESYLDVIERLRPIIIELERLQVGVCLVTHQVVLRTLLAYFLGISLIDMPRIVVPLHTLYALRIRPHGADLVTYRYDEELDTMVEDKGF